MTINVEVRNKTTAILKPSGRLDTTSASLLEKKLRQWGDEITELVLDFDDLDYISSMGLRVLLAAQKSAKERNRQFSIRNMRSSVREVFELTGLINLVVREEGFALLRKDEAGEGIVLFFNGMLMSENVSSVSEELRKIKKQGTDDGRPVRVILDMKNLSGMGNAAFKQLRQVIADKEWENVNLLVRNAPPKYQKEVVFGGLGQLGKES